MWKIPYGKTRGGAIPALSDTELGGYYHTEGNHEGIIAS